MKKINLATLMFLGLFASALPAGAGNIIPPVAVPESGQTLLLLVIALIALIAWRQKAAKRL
jgi:protein-S-isoprenylcysteine O-methyltransferase Ste14